LNKVLILAEGKEATNFISSITKYHMNVAEFDIIYQNSSDILEEFKVDGINFYQIPFTNFLDLNFFKLKNYSKIIIVIKNRFFALNALKSMQIFIEKNIFIEFVDFWGLDIQMENVSILKLPNLINSTLVDLLPDVPVFARNIGLGKEEIMEIQVPSSSSFIYRSVELINKDNKNKWQIVAIYRKDNIILPNKMSTIHPFDRLLIVGQPNILKDVFKNIKKDVGFFPAPYGNNIYLLIDKKEMSKEETSKLLKTAIHLQKKLKSKKLIVKVINPNLHTFNKLNKFSNIEVHIDYFNTDKQSVIMEDILKFSVGMFIINNDFYYKNIDFLLKLKKPFLKVGKESIKKCDSTAVLLRDSDEVAEISPVVFDISSQLKHKIKFFDYDPDNINKKKKDIVKYYENLSKMYYYKNVEFIIDNKNPYFEIKKNRGICFFVPFNKNIERKKFLATILAPKIAKIQTLFDEYNQFMIPTKD